jgi:hypothetical protein
MVVLLGYFLIAAVAGIAASAMIGLFLTNFIVGRFKASDRVSRWINLVTSQAKMANHHPWRFGSFSRHGSQARFPGVLVPRK